MVLKQSNAVLNVFLLAFSVVLFFNYVTTYGQSLLPWVTNSCEKECIETYFNGPPSIRDPALLAVVRDNYLFPPPPDPVTTPYDITTPLWGRLVDWNVLQEKLFQIWNGERPGVFVEVGAADGEFMSQTLVLERNLSWTGLLVEPDPRSFKIMQQRRRNAWTSPLCIHHRPPFSRKYWLRDLEDYLPEHFVQLLMARSKLYEETLSGDEERGTTTAVPCVPLSTLLLASNITSIDFLTICTGVDQDEIRIADVINNRRFDVKTLLIHYPTGRLFSDPYPTIPGYILDMEHSTLLVKLYIKRSHCQLLSSDDCKKINHYDTMEACYKYYCFNFHTVRTIAPKRVAGTA